MVDGDRTFRMVNPVLRTPAVALDRADDTIPQELPEPPGSRRDRLRWLRRRNADVLACVALCLVVVVTWLPRLQGPLDLRWDAGAYYVLGTSLAEGKGYRLLNEPGEIEAIQYPPGLPTLVAVHQKVLGTSDPHVVGFWLRLTFFAMSLAYAVASYAVLRRFLHPSFAAAATFICIFVAGGGDALMAGTPYGLLIMLFVFFALRTQPGSGWLAGFCAVGSFMLRTSGIAALLAWAGESALERRWRSFAWRALLAALPVLVWQAYGMRVQASSEYAYPAYEYQRAPYLFNNVSYATNLRLRDPFVPELGTASTAEIVLRSARGLPHLPQALGQIVSASQGTWETAFSRAGLRAIGGRQTPAIAARIVLVAFGALTLLGIAVLARRRQYVLTMLLIGTILTVCATPWIGNWGRYLGPTAPLFVLCWFLGTAALLRRLGSRVRALLDQRGMTLFALALLPILLVKFTSFVDTQRKHHQPVQYEGHNGEQISYRLYNYRSSYRSFDASVDWLRQRARPADIVVTTMPYWVFLRTGLRAVMPPADPDPAEVLRLLDGVPATYVIAGGSTAVVWAGQHVYPALEASPDRWTPIHTSPEGDLVIYERQRVTVSAAPR